MRLIEGDDGTRLTKRQIATALKNPESEDQGHAAKRKAVNNIDHDIAEDFAAFDGFMGGNDIRERKRFTDQRGQGARLEERVMALSAAARSAALSS